MKYYTLTGRIRARLQREIFNGPSIEVYGEETDRLEREERFNSVRSALAHLIHNEHYTSDVELGMNIKKLRDAHDKLMAHPDIDKYFSPNRTARLKQIVGEIVARARDNLNPDFNADDIRLFVELCIKGRGHYRQQGYDPQEFVPENLLMFGSLIAGNFETYRATLNHEYV